MDAVPAIEGYISPMELLRVFRHIIECAQLTITAYHELNSLFLVVPPSVWPVYSNRPHPTPPLRPDTNPPYINGNTVQNKMIKDQWAVNKKYFWRRSEHEQSTHRTFSPANAIRTAPRIQGHPGQRSQPQIWNHLRIFLRYLLFVCPGLITFLYFHFLCLKWCVIEMYGWELSTVQRWASNSQYWWSYGSLIFLEEEL